MFFGDAEVGFSQVVTRVLEISGPSRDFRRS